jgi:hypothetical protein
MAGLKYLECMGKAPVLTDSAKNGMLLDAQSRKDRGVPVLDVPVPAWTDDQYNAAQRDAVAQNANVDPRMFEQYFKLINTDGALRTEEPVQTQDMYAELTKVLQAVVTDQNADVQALLDTADTNLQAILDSTVNK